MVRSSEKILLVDDDPRLLSGLVRQLEDDFNLQVAHSAEVALKKMETQGPFAVVMSDMHMPGMTGLDYLTIVKQKYPSCVTMLLTAYADIELALNLVNEARVFRFLLKPCSSQTVSSAFNDALKQYRLIHAEHDILHRTLMGTIQVLTEIIATYDPFASNEVLPLRQIIAKLCDELGTVHRLDLELAAMLYELGVVSIPTPLLLKVRTGQQLSPDEQEIVNRIPQLSAKLLSQIPRLEKVQEIIRLQTTPLWSKDQGTLDESILFSARVFGIARAYVRMVMDGDTQEDSLRALEGSDVNYEPRILAALRRALQAEIANTSAHTYDESKTPILRIKVSDLMIGDCLAEDVLSSSGMLLYKAKVSISEPILLRLKNHKFNDLIGIKRVPPRRGTI